MVDALKKLIDELRKALDEVDTLNRLIPICAQCKKVRDDTESWQRLENYFQEHWSVDFSHGLCPDCFAKQFPGVPHVAVFDTARYLSVQVGSDAEMAPRQALGATPFALQAQQAMRLQALLPLLVNYNVKLKLISPQQLKVLAALMKDIADG